MQKEGLILKLIQNGVGDKMLKWIRDFLNRKHASTGEGSKKDNHNQKWFHRGPTLFISFINDLPKQFP